MWEVTFQVLLLAGIAWAIGVLYSVKGIFLDLKVSVDHHATELNRQLDNITERLEEMEQSGAKEMAPGFGEKTHPNLEVAESIRQNRLPK